ncbi:MULTISPECIES: hypothetical protein [unclassified Sphingomonas]|nr:MULTISPECIES: hypothetical protein [unclassified Sphingomonas]
MSGEFTEFERFMIRCIVYSNLAAGLFTCFALVVMIMRRILA